MDAGQLTVDDLVDVRSAAWKVRSKWESIGIELKLHKHDLDVIKKDNIGQSGECFTEMLTLWLKRGDPPPSLSALATALKQPTVDEPQLAEDIQCISAELTTEFIDLSFPLLETVVRDEHTKRELEGILQEESIRIIRKFRILRFKLFDLLEEKNVAVDKLVEYLQEEITDPLLSEARSITFEDVKKVIKRHTSFFDYELIEYIISLVGTDKDMEPFKKYEAAFIDYSKRRLYKCPATYGDQNTEGSLLHIKLDSKYDDSEWDLQDLKQFQYRLSSRFNRRVHIFHLKSIGIGCILVTFVIPLHIQEAIFSLTTEQERELAGSGILKLTCGEYTFCDLQSTGMQHVESEYITCP